MKILYAFQGTGNGHLIRAHEILPILSEKAEVDILISGKNSSLPFTYKAKYNLKGLNFVIGKNGGINLWKTILNLNLFRFFKEVRSLPVKQYDLIINDFEPVSAWAARLKAVNIVSLSHQNALLNNEDSILKSKKYFLERLLLKYYAPATNKFGFDFKTSSSSIFTPIIRQKIRNQRVSNKGHYTVYLPAYNHEKIAKALANIPIVKWHIFSKETNKLIYKKNIIIYPVNEFDFVKSMASSNGVICGAGFETPSEALYMNKKLMVIPMKSQFEQKYNAEILKEMGVRVIKKLNKKRLAKIAKWINSDTTVTVNYNDNTEDILDSIVLPYYNLTLLPTIPQ